MDKLSLQIITYIIVAEECIVFQIKGQPILFTLDKRLLKNMKADPHCPRYNKVHFQDFFLLIIDDTLINVTAEMPRFQSKSNIMQEFAVPVLLRVEKEPEVVKDVVKQIVNDYAFLDRSG